MSDKETPLRSPCVSVCALDEDDVCVGCYRTGQEISYWWDADNSKRREILALARHRAAGKNPFLVE